MLLPKERLQKLTKLHSAALMAFGTIFGSLGYFIHDEIPTIIIVPFAIFQFLLVCIFNKKCKIQTQIRFLCVCAAIIHLNGPLGITFEKLVLHRTLSNVASFYLTDAILGSIFAAILLLMYYEPKFILFQLIFINLNCIFGLSLMDTHFQYMSKIESLNPCIIANVAYIMIYIVSKTSTKNLIIIQKRKKESKELNENLRIKMDEIEELITQQQKMIAAINQTSLDVTTASKELSQIVNFLLNSATAQTNSIEEISLAIKDITDEAHINAINADNLLQITEKTSEYIQSGKTNMDNISKVMDEIKNNSSKISDIMDDLNDLAFLTNMLSLNAIIEAYRAGKDGAAFNSVAKDIQDLALKCKNVTNKTNKLIISTVNATKKGVIVVNKTEAAINKMVEKNSISSNIVLEISNTSKLQVSNIEQIAENISQISNVTSQNNVTSEKTCAASDLLYSQAQKLNTLAN